MRTILIAALLFASAAQAEDETKDDMVQVIVDARDLNGAVASVPITVGDQLLGQTGEAFELPDYTVSVTVGEGEAQQVVRVAPLGPDLNKYLVRLGDHGDGLALVDVAAPPPRYPPAAKRKGIVGTVNVEVVFGPDGLPIRNKDAACLGYATTSQDVRRRTWHMNKCVEVVSGRSELVFDVLVAAAKAKVDPLAEGTTGVRGRSSVVFVAE